MSHYYDYRGFPIEVYQEPRDILNPASPVVWKSQIRNALNVVIQASRGADSAEEAEFAAEELIDSWN